MNSCMHHEYFSGPVRKNKNLVQNQMVIQQYIPKENKIMSLGFITSLRMRVWYHEGLVENLLEISQFLCLPLLSFKTWCYYLATMHLCPRKLQKENNKNVMMIKHNFRNCSFWKYSNIQIFWKYSNIFYLFLLFLSWRDNSKKEISTCQKICY